MNQPNIQSSQQTQRVGQTPSSANASENGQFVNGQDQSTSRYRIEVKRDLCIGAASCVAVAPETFALDDENIAIVKNPAGNPDETILMAAQACPTKAIYVFERDKQVWPE